MMTREKRRMVGVLVLTGWMLWLNAGQGPSPLRSMVNLLFLLFCPGMAFIPFLRLKETWVELILAVLLSLGLEAAIAGGMVYGRVWLPAESMWILAGISLVGTWTSRGQTSGPTLSRSEVSD